MDDIDRQIERVERRQVFYVRSDRLWEEDAGGWREALSTAGLRPGEIRRVIDESGDSIRGVMRVELARPAPTDEVAVALEADAGSVPEVPEEGHVYQSSEAMLLSPATGRMGAEPFEIDAGVPLAIRGELPGNQWAVVPLDGPHENRMAVLKKKEWDNASPDLEDLGPEPAGSDALLNPADPDTPDAAEPDDDEESDAADHDTEKGNPYTVKDTFPDWPDKADFQSYFPFDVEKWEQEKREEIANRDDGGGRGF